MRHPGVPLFCHDHFDARFVSRNEMYQDLLIPCGARYVCALVASVQGDRSVGFAVARTPDQGPYGRRERDWMDLLRPHVVRASYLYLECWNLRLTNAIARRAMDTFEYPILVLDRNRRTRLFNEAAYRLVRERTVLADDGRRLRVLDANADRRFSSLVESAAGGGEHPGRGGAVPLPDRHGAIRFQAMVVPLRAESQITLAWQEPLTLVALADPCSKPALRTGDLQVLFGLSLAEARIAQGIAEGKSLEMLAQTHGISVYTARNQLKAVLRKTGSKRQSDLVRLLNIAPQLKRI